MTAVDHFEASLRALLRVEGGYSDDAADSGGATRFGVTEAQARAHGYTGPMAGLPLDTARRIYRAQYWELLRLDDIARLTTPVAAELFDTAVNMGQARAGAMLQRALTLFNGGGAHYPDLRVDGTIGPVTLDALRRYLARRGPMAETVLLRALNVQQGAAYLDLAERREKDERFVFGWLANRVEGLV